MLREMAEIGMDIARALRTVAQAQAAQAVAQPAPARVASDPGLGFARVARAIRQTLALRAKLLDDSRERDRKIAADAQQRKTAAARKRRKTAEIARAVELAIDDEAETESDAEHLLADLRERLEDAEIDDEIGDGNVGDIAARICRDLGLTADWSLWQNEIWFATEGWKLCDDEDAEDEEAAGEAEAEAAAPAEPQPRQFPLPILHGYCPWAERPEPAETGSDPPEDADG